jgi:hypothetical protein
MSLLHTKTAMETSEQLFEENLPINQYHAGQLRTKLLSAQQNLIRGLISDLEEIEKELNLKEIGNHEQKFVAEIFYCQAIRDLQEDLRKLIK